MFSKSVISSLTTTIFLACVATAATPAANQPFYPSKTQVRAAVNPAKAANGTVVVNAASFLPGITPGGLATVFGTNLSDITGTVSANSDPFPNVLANVSITVNGIAAPIFSISYANGQDQISFAIPWQTQTGLGAAEVKVFDYGNLVADVIVDSYTDDPGIFAYEKYGTQYAVALHSSDYALITPEDAAYRGEIIILYTTGLGPVDQFIQNGYGAPAKPLANTLDKFHVRIAGEDARVYFSGLAPGFVGLYQINMELPGDLPAGDLSLKIFSDYADSQTVYLPVK